MSTKHKTYCRNCSAYCGIEVEVDNNKVIAVTGDKDNGASEGYFCVKGYSSMDFHNGEDRLVTCKKRQPDGTFAEIDQEVLMDEVADKLKHIIAEHGPRAVGFFTGTHAAGTLLMPMFKSLRSCIGSPNIFTTMTIDQSAKWVKDCRMGMVPTWKYNDQEADVLMAVGSNPAVSHFSMPYAGVRSVGSSQAIRDAKKRGMKFIVVDPRVTETARLADIHLRINPGDDPVLFAGLIHIVIKNNWHDKAFCERYTQQFEELKQATEPFTAEYVAKRLDIPLAQLEEVARLMSTSEKCSVGSGTGSNMSRNSNLSEHMLEAFNAICGGYRKPGDTFSNPGVFMSAPRVFSVIPANRTWEQEPKAAHDNSIGQICGEFPAAIMPEEMTTDGPDRIRALIVVGGNPITALGHPDKTVEAFKSLDLLVTLDPRMTDTAKLSDYVVPPALPYERYDATVVSDFCNVIPFAQLTKPVLTPPPGVLPEWEFAYGIAKRLGHQLELKPPIFGVPEALQGIKLDMENKPNQEEMIKEIIKQTPVDYDTLDANPSGITPDVETVTIQAPEEDDGARLSLMPDDVAAELAVELQAPEKNNAFPLVLSSRRLLDTMNGSFRDASRTRKRYPSNPLFMHPDDIATYHLENGQTAIVESKHGKVTAIVKQDPTMKQGIVALTHMWGSALTDSINDPLGSHTGRLTSLNEDIQTINHMPMFSGVEVKVSAM